MSSQSVSGKLKSLWNKSSKPRPALDYTAACVISSHIHRRGGLSLTHLSIPLIGRLSPERKGTCACEGNQCSPGSLHVRQMRAQPASMTGRGSEGITRFAVRI
ncbi:hypothetical protein BaRGS_00013047 [Batillaria attramentaria]|uniref:Uncharacterized protein n=1 Tax=Batillaria attramentaria TaxID=370345 RepID=A0ABD0L8I4_9CAEN